MKTRDVYDGWHERRSALEAQLDARPSVWEEFVERRVGVIRGRRVLDIGCGRGRISAMLATRGARVIAADFSSRAVALTQHRTRCLVDRPLVVCADACHLPLPPASVDCVVSAETIEHVAAPRAVLTEFFRVLRPGGRLVLTFPSHLNLTGLYRVYLWARGRPYNSGDEVQPIEHFLVAPRVVRALRRVGFLVVATEGLAHYVPWPGRLPLRLRWIERAPGVRTVLKSSALHYGVVAERR